MELTNEEKAEILNQHIKNAAVNIYNLNLSLLSENSLNSPDSNILQDLNSRLSDQQSRMDALLEEYAKLNLA